VKIIIKRGLLRVMGIGKPSEDFFSLPYFFPLECKRKELPSCAQGVAARMQMRGTSFMCCSIPGTTRKKLLGLERGPLSLVSTTEEILDRKEAAPV
jgi:hypothetical protein